MCRMAKTREWFVRTDDGRVYGPAEQSALVQWAEDGRIEPSSFLSQDRISWKPAQLMAELCMSWLVEMEPGKVFGPFNRKMIINLRRQGTVPLSAKFYRLHEFPVDKDPPPVEKIVEKVVEKRVEVPVEKIVEKRVEVPVEKIVEKRVEVPVEKIVEKIVEKRVEVPVEKIVEKIVEVPVEKIVEKIVEVEPPARSTLVVPEVVEPMGKIPPVKSPGSLFANVGREQLAALEAQAQRELASAKGPRFGFGLFGRK